MPTRRSRRRSSNRPRNSAEAGCPRVRAPRLPCPAPPRGGELDPEDDFCKGCAVMTTNGPSSWDRIPAIVSFPDTARFTETYGFAGPSGTVNLEGPLLRPRDRPSATVYLFMHPTSTLQQIGRASCRARECHYV